LKAQFISEFDKHLFAEGSHLKLYDKLGAHLTSVDGVSGTNFAVWAPAAETVSVVGDFNGWCTESTPMTRLDNSGIWNVFVPNVSLGDAYKYCVTPAIDSTKNDHSDPFGFAAELRPKTASIVCDLTKHSWSDSEWMNTRAARQTLEAPISIYEVHLGSWMRDEHNHWLTYRDLASKLTEYVLSMGFTHVELMPIAEHPFDGSWGYQTTGYFAPTSRYGSPEDFMFLIDTLHQNKIGVVLDWVPGHFPKDGHALALFDGTHLYDHSDPRQGEHKEWGTYVFNYGRYEVEDFLICNALFWFDKYHIDGLRVDAVASMLYLNYSRPDGDWIPNKYGGTENLEAITFLKQLNEYVFKLYPDVMMIAEESTAWPSVSAPTYLGGLGFGFKWDMGWMHDTLNYLAQDPINRKYHHNKLTFRAMYANTENFMLPLSHDEVVHGKGSLLNKMAGDDWQKFANLRLLLGQLFTTPAKKLLFMGGEFGQRSEWNFDGSLDWSLLKEPAHIGIQQLTRDLNNLYRKLPALHQLDCSPEGFSWVDCNNFEQSVIAFLRKSKSSNQKVLVICNFTPVIRTDYKLTVDQSGFWEEIFNSDSAAYGGSDVGNRGGLYSISEPDSEQFSTLSLQLPPLAILIFRAPATTQLEPHEA
jgi:1,4-alpha-glucan branching enzyme